MRKIKEASARKRGQKVISPVPYLNLAEKSKKVIDDLEINIKKKEDYINSNRDNPQYTPEKVRTTDFLNQFTSDKKDEMDVF